MGHILGHLQQCQASVDICVLIIPANHCMPIEDHPKLQLSTSIAILQWFLWLQSKSRICRELGGNGIIVDTMNRISEGGGRSTVEGEREEGRNRNHTLGAAKLEIFGHSG